MRRVAALIALLLAGCTARWSRDYARPAPPVPASWPAGRRHLRQSEAALPAVTYRDIFRDPRLQALIEQALANNRDLMVAAANIAAAREQVSDPARRAVSRSRRVGAGDRRCRQRAARSGATPTIAPASAITSFELDLFGRLPLADRGRAQPLSRDRGGGARATRLALVGDIADAWLTYAADCEPARDRRGHGRQRRDERAPDPRPARGRHRAAHRPAPGRADPRQPPRPTSPQQTHGAGAGRQPAAAAGRRAGRSGSCCPASIDAGRADDRDAARRARVRCVLLRRPDVVAGRVSTARRQCRDRRRARRSVPADLADRPARACQHLARRPVHRRRLPLEPGSDATYTIFHAGAGRANVRLTEAQRDAALAAYQRTIQTAFREVADALARRGTIGEQLRARQAQREAAADNYRLTEARYRDGIETSSAASTRSGPIIRRSSTGADPADAATNLVDLYRSLGGDSLLGTSDQP